MRKSACAICGVQATTLFFVCESSEPAAPGLLVCNDCFCKKEVVVNQEVAPSYAGVCTSCMCAYDVKHRRTQVLNEEQFRQFKCKGLCFTCQTVKAAVVAAGIGWQDVQGGGM